jgi:phosphatidate cytidylyltransferase
VLRTRIISAAVLLVLVAIPAVLGGLPFFLLIGLIGGLGAWEYANLLRQGGHHPSLPLCIFITLLLIVQAYWSSFLSLQLVLAIVVAGSLLAALWQSQPQPITNWGLGLGGALYLGVMLSHFVLLRNLDQGLAWLLVGALPIFAADSGAYFAGRAFGRHPWWPRHSPKKTWEGYLAGAAASSAAAALLGAWLLGMAPVAGALLGLVIGLIAPLGDLAESMLKRQVGAKDSSRLIPGHGGVLDRIDSLLIGLPIAYYWATLFPHLPA